MNNKKELSLDEIKELELKTLVYIDNICRENNIDYCLDYGTLLGCIRHKGFIPWDDDIDISMTKEDYQKFKVAINKSNERYKLIDAYTDDDYHYPFGKVVDTYTKVIEDGVLPINNLGLYVDVFIKYPIPNNKIMWKMEYYRYQLRVYLLYFTSNTVFNNCLFVLISKILKPFVNPNKLCKNMMFILSKQDKDKNFCVNGTAMRRLEDYNSYIEKCDMRFEGYKFLVPKKYDLVLKNLYGDYMKLPPKEQQVSFHDYHAYTRNK